MVSPGCLCGVPAEPPRCPPGCPGVSPRCPHGVCMVPRGVPIVSLWPHDVSTMSLWCPRDVPPYGVPTVPLWCPQSVLVMSLWCPHGVPWCSWAECRGQDGTGCSGVHEGYAGIWGLRALSLCAGTGAGTVPSCGPQHVPLPHMGGLRNVGVPAVPTEPHSRAAHRSAPPTP